jgi:hypothetical protein
MSIELISAAIGLLLTLMIFSYLIGDNPLFRIAVYVFIGVSAGYAATVVWHYIIVPKLFQPIAALDPLVIFPLVFSFLVLTKLFPRVSIGNLAMAILVGVGAAAAIGGALLGTVVPQLQAAIDAFDLRSAGDLGTRMSMFGEGVVMLLGTGFTLAAFQFSAGRAADGTPKRPRLLELVAWVGRIFVAITLGVIFAGVYMAALTAMIERLSSLINFIRQLLTGI